MELENLNMLYSSVVFRLRDHLTDITISREELHGLLTPELSIAQTIDGRICCTSVGDQMEVLIGVNRIDIKDLNRQSPRTEDIARIAEGILEALKVDAKSFKSYGINYEFEVPLSTGESGAFILKTFIRSDLEDYLQHLRGAELTVLFDLDDRKITTKIAPRWNKPESDKIFVNINVHKDLEESEQVPGREQLAKEITSYFKKVKKALSRVPE